MASCAACYFDHINGGRPLAEAVAAMAPWLGVAANPQMGHSGGRQAHMALEAARAQVAALIGAAPETVLLTGSGTEANNLGLKGFLKANRRRGTQILLSAVEHPTIERAARRMVDAGYTLDTIPVDRHGRVDPHQVAERLSDDTALVCVQLANPEVGTVQDIAAIAALCKPRKAALLVDAIAAAGRMPVDVGQLGADLLTLSSSNLCGPAGAAALYLRRGLRLQPEIDGGIQEGGRRGGLENVAALVGFGTAADITRQTLTERITHLDQLAVRFREQLNNIPGIHLTGAHHARAAGHVSLRVDGVEGESLLIRLDEAGIAASSGSFCGAKAMKASAVLSAMGYPPHEALSGVVFSFGPGNSLQEVDQGAELLRQCIDRCHQALSGGGRSAVGPTEANA